MANEIIEGTKRCDLAMATVDWCVKKIHVTFTNFVYFMRRSRATNHVSRVRQTTLENKLKHLKTFSTVRIARHKETMKREKNTGNVFYYYYFFYVPTGRQTSDSFNGNVSKEKCIAQAFGNELTTQTSDFLYK